jgi:hypothetical protein
MRTLLVLFALVGFGLTGCEKKADTPAPPATDPPAESTPADPGATTPAPSGE